MSNKLNEGIITNIFTWLTKGVQKKTLSVIENDPIILEHKKIIDNSIKKLREHINALNKIHGFN